MKNAIYGGVNAAVLTAMGPDLAPDLDRMAAHARWLLANGCNGLGILGSACMNARRSWRGWCRAASRRRASCRGRAARRSRIRWN